MVGPLRRLALNGVNCGPPHWGRGLRSQAHPALDEEPAKLEALAQYP